MSRQLFTALALAAAATASQGAAVVPVFTTFGDLAGATFGGSGIPTNPTAITTGNGLTLGLTAFGRYANPALTNNGAGTFTATPGLNDGLDPGNPHAVGTTWGFGYYVNAGTAPLGQLQVDLFYDLDAAIGNDLSTYGRIDLDAALNVSGGGALSLLQDAQNLNFSFFFDGVPGVVFPPANPFNASASGEYGFVLRVRDQAGNDLGTSAILVDVNGVPEPGSLALVGLALVGLAALRRTRRA